MFSPFSSYLGVRLIFDFVWTTPELCVHPSLSADLFTPFHSSDAPDKQMNWIVVVTQVTASDLSAIFETCRECLEIFVFFPK